MNEDDKRRLMILRIDSKLILDLLMPGKHYYQSSENPLPEDTEIKRIFIKYDNPDEIALVLYSKSFDPVPKGGLIPVMLSPSFSKIDIYYEL